MEMYYPNGEKMNCLEEFVDYYSKMYFYWADKDQEDRIVDLLSKGLKRVQGKPNIEDVKAIMEWKTGRKANNKNLISTRRKDQYINLQEIVDYFPQEMEITPEKFSEKIADNDDVNNVGPVYGITLLFFASKGKYPIYDRFAELAIRALLSEKEAKPKECGWYAKTLPNKFETAYERYIENLKLVVQGTDVACTGCTQESRKLDRALWVYGHMFQK